MLVKWLVCSLWLAVQIRKKLCLLEWRRVLSSADPPGVIDGAHSTAAGIAVAAAIRYTLRPGIGIKAVTGNGRDRDFAGRGTRSLC
jgi:hypothetical protein